MDARFELIRRAQAGDAVAVQTLIERNQGVVYRLALALLDDPDEAAEAVKETFHSASGRLDEFGGNVDFSTWLYPIAVDICRKRLGRRRLAARIPAPVRRLLHLADPPQARPAEGLVQAVLSLEDEERLPVILRYDQGLIVHEIAPMLGLNETRVQKRLKAGRRQVRAAVGGSFPAAVGDMAAAHGGITHRTAQDWMEDAADHLITDTHAEKLRLHLKDCEACREASGQLEAFNDRLSAAFEKRWAGQAPPAAGFSSAVSDLRHRRRAGGRVANLLGAGVITILMVAMIAFLPGLTPLEAIPMPATATPTNSPRERRGPRVRPTPAPLKPDPNLLKTIYPGRLAFINFEAMGNHVYSMQPDGSDMRQLTDGIAVDSSPTWSPDGTQIAYLSIPDAWGVNGVNVIDADGKNMRTISRPDFPLVSAPSVDWPDSQVIHYPLYGPPQWSPDGKWIAATVYVTAKKSYLALLSPDGGTPRYLHADGVDRWLIAWSPDSRSLAAFSKGRGGLWVWQIDQAEIAGENPRRVAGDTLWDIGLGLAWAPDSSKIAVIVGVLKDAAIDVSLMTYDQEGKIDRAMPISGELEMRFPLRKTNLSWSPDGRYLAFMPVFALPDHLNSEIVLIQLNRNRQQILVQTDEPLNSYTWSPDGKWLAYTAGVEIWAASLEAFERNRDYLAMILPSGGYGLSWQPANAPNP